MERRKEKDGAVARGGLTAGAQAFRALLPAHLPHQGPRMTPCTLRPHPTQAHLAHLQRTGKGCVALAALERSCRLVHPPCER
ncbi:unnamed protein product [Rangifer tarandus platyrhynchus]|uniref:Uncharacterized protein n=2 Tax=Rangifer tarandus platyrhynchus TaxID=3082113 RepID=A0ABN8ZKB1_RANTA|nr:unnamed protein product [Rangifer tarandus platyrhynchus]CAI9706444.1 unnamed protein product [Rangifer tarandus platyrhynchus]